MTRILLVEDSKFLRLATERALANAGYEVYTAADGETALRIAREKAPHVILLDLLLPKLAGLDVLKALKSDASTTAIPVVVLTGMSQKNEDRLRKDGAVAFLGKSELSLDKGPHTLVNALADIIRQLNLTVPINPFAATL
jgi:CheY-like chemotaxis protein